MAEPTPPEPAPVEEEWHRYAWEVTAAAVSGAASGTASWIIIASDVVEAAQKAMVSCIEMASQDHAIMELRLLGPVAET